MTALYHKRHICKVFLAVSFVHADDGHYDDEVDTDYSHGQQGRNFLHYHYYYYYYYCCCYNCYYYSCLQNSNWDYNWDQCGCIHHSHYCYDDDEIGDVGDEDSSETDEESYSDQDL